jgi:hypothetical protein
MGIAPSCFPLGGATPGIRDSKKEGTRDIWESGDPQKKEKGVT